MHSDYHYEYLCVCDVIVGVPVTLLRDLQVKAAVQHNEMLCPTVTDTMSAADSHVMADATQLKPDCNVELERSGVIAPPLTARNAQNPTVERNTHHGSSEELAVEGNALVARRAADQPGTENPAVTASQQTDVSQSRRLSALRPDQLHRISYVQNVVDNAAPGTGTATAPKRQNVDIESARCCNNDTMDKCAACPVLADNDNYDDDDDNDASQNAADDGAGDNLGFESSSSPCYDAVPAPASCLV